MKKIKMNLRQLEHAEVLTRSQLKKVLGGTFGSTTSHVTTFYCGGSCNAKVNGVVVYGNCKSAGVNLCYCSSGVGSCSGSGNPPIH